MISEVMRALMSLVPEPRTEDEMCYVNWRQLPPGSVDLEAARAKCPEFAESYDAGMARLDKELGKLREIMERIK